MLLVEQNLFHLVSSNKKDKLCLQCGADVSVKMEIDSQICGAHEKYPKPKQPQPLNRPNTFFAKLVMVTPVRSVRSIQFTQIAATQMNDSRV